MQEGAAVDLAALGGWVAVALAGIAAIYVYIAAILMVIARKTATPNRWMAWIPVLNLVLMCNIGRRSAAWAILILVPFANLIGLVLLWMWIAEAMGKSKALGVLMLIPGVNLLMPLLIASGPGPTGSRSPAAATSPRCPRCGAPLDAGATFCGDCGAPLAARVLDTPAISSSQPAPKSSSVGIAVAALALVLLGAAGWLFLGRGSTPQRQAPAMPQRMAGSIKEFPVDTDRNAPARPGGVSTRKLARGNAAANLPANALPPGVSTATLGRRADSMTSTTYRARPQDPPVNVHVLNTTPGQPGLGPEVASQVAAAAGPGSESTGIQVRSPTGAAYSGYRIGSPRIVVYVLDKQGADISVIVFAPDAAAAGVAERLAGNVGNGAGLNDYPEVQSALWSLPANLPAGLVLEEAKTFLPGDVGLSPTDIEGLMGGAGDAQARRILDQVKRLLPEGITQARYQDASRRDWNVLIGDYGGPLRAWATWLFARGLMGLAGTRPVEVGGASGLAVEQPGGQVVLFQRGGSVAAVGGPTGGSLEDVLALAAALQF